MDAQRVSLDVPVNHDAATFVANVPLGSPVLIPCTEVLGVGRARCSVMTPNGRIASVQGSMGHSCDRMTQRIGAHVLDITLYLARSLTKAGVL